MKVLIANIEDVMREAAARWTLLAYFFLSSIFILIFASAVNLDIVDGALAGAKLFGKELQMQGDVGQAQWEKLIVSIESVLAPVLYGFCTLLAIFATAHLVPRLQEKGTIDLYLSRPVSRVKLLLSRYVAGLILAGSNIVYLVGSIWVIVTFKTQVAHPRFLLAGGMMLLVIASLLAFAFLVGVITSSTAVSIMTTYGLTAFSVILALHDRIAAAVSQEWQAWLIHALYWVVPKSFEIGQAVVAFIAGETMPQHMREAFAITAAPFLTTAAFGVACLVLASWLFQRKEF